MKLKWIEGYKDTNYKSITGFGEAKNGITPVYVIEELPAGNEMLFKKRRNVFSDNI